MHLSPSSIQLRDTLAVG